ncbi:MAG: diphthine--ammonia ligase [Phycisphaeraceae bacterium]
MTELSDLAGQHFMTSWSGGKDCALALDRAMRAGGVSALILTTMLDDAPRSRGHGLHADVLQEQARAMGIPIRMLPTTWKDYTANYLNELKTIHETSRIRHGVFGDIDLQPHRDWVERVCMDCRVTAHLPLWEECRWKLLHEVFERRIRCMIISVKDGSLPRHMLGQMLTPELIDQIVDAGADACGENGEYHTLVVDGPMFRRPIKVEPGQQILRDGYWFLDVRVEHPACHQLTEATC